jgi:hypothetical protein
MADSDDSLQRLAERLREFDEPARPRVSLPRSRVLAAVFAGVTVGIVLLAGVGPGGLFLPRVTVCQLGARIGNYTIWTLGTPLNKPPGVNVSTAADYGAYNFTFSSGSLTVGALHLSTAGGGWFDDSPSAGISAQGIQLNWSVFSVRNVSQVGGFAGPCTQAYAAEAAASPVQACGGFVTVPLANNTSDLVEPHVWNGTGSGWPTEGCLPTTPGAYYWFDTSFHPNATGAAAPVSLNLCGRPGSVRLDVGGVARVPIVVSVPYAGHQISAAGFETWISTVSLWTANYTVPGGWLWMIAPVGPVSSPMNTTAEQPALVAFERLPCS